MVRARCAQWSYILEFVLWTETAENDAMVNIWSSMQHMVGCDVMTAG